MITSHKPIRSWTTHVRAQLGRAAELLPSSPVQVPGESTLDRYRDWLDHNDLELALNELERLGDSNPVPLAYWAHLRDAAAEMRLWQRAVGFRRRLCGDARPDPSY